MKEIVLNRVRRTPNYRKYVALVDDEDFEELNQYDWCVHKRQGNRHAVRTIRVNGKRGALYIHQQITGFKMTDHKDGNGLNNQKANLRECTIQQNSVNRRPAKNSASKFLGVGLSLRKHKNKTYQYWRADIKRNKESVYIGCFKTEIEAARAYNEQARKIHGEFARLNEI